MKNPVEKSRQKHVRLIYPVVLYLAIAISPVFAAGSDDVRSLAPVSDMSGIILAKATQSDNSYLDALSEEADSTASVSPKPEQGGKYRENLAKMETLIRDKRSSTYGFYKKLTPENKTRIFELYAADDSGTEARLTHIQKQVLDLYLQQ